jgi:hypothetical protein
LFIIDELSEFANLDGLPEFLTNARSKGGCFCGGFQTPDGMKAVLGEFSTSVVLDQFWVWALCRMGPNASAEWASALVGEVELEEKNQSVGPNGVSVTTNVVKRRALLPEWFKDLPGPTPETGVSGVFITPETGAYTHVVPGNEVAKARSRYRADVPNFVPRPKSHQELPPWTEEDYRRLGLTPGRDKDDDKPVRCQFVGTTRTGR